MVGSYVGEHGFFNLKVFAGVDGLDVGTDVSDRLIAVCGIQFHTGNYTDRGDKKQRDWTDSKEDRLMYLTGLEARQPTLQ
jgi:hypothetical protein